MMIEPLQVYVEAFYSSTWVFSLLRSCGFFIFLLYSRQNFSCDLTPNPQAQPQSQACKVCSVKNCPHEVFAIWQFLNCSKFSVQGQVTQKSRLLNSKLEYKSDRPKKCFLAGSSLQFIRRDAHLFWRKNKYSIGKVKKSLHSLSVHEGLLVCRKWQMSLGCASSAGSSSSVNSWCELCERPRLLFRGEGRCSSSGFKINQSGMWPLGPKGFIHTGTGPLLSASLSHPNMSQTVSCTFIQLYLKGWLAWHELHNLRFWRAFCASPEPLVAIHWGDTLDNCQQGLRHESSGNHNSGIPL